MKTLSFRIVTAALLAAGACTLTSCETPTGRGAAIGAGSGAIIGGLATNRVGGAAAGAAIGAVTGGLIGAAVEDEESYGPRRNYPIATLTDRRGYVISPYSPYYEIDVRGVPRGALVRDPSCGRLFVKP